VGGPFSALPGITPDVNAIAPIFVRAVRTAAARRSCKEFERARKQALAETAAAAPGVDFEICSGRATVRDNPPYCCEQEVEHVA
jgi:hypothetical protein